MGKSQSPHSTFESATVASALLGLILLLPTPLQLPQPVEFELVREGNPFLLQDDFSKDPRSGWIFQEAADWDSAAEYLALTKPGGGWVGVAWLKVNITSPFTAEFRYRVGGGSGADGFIFMFYKDWDYEPGIGGYLGFLCRPREGRPCPRDEAPGYGVEFDNYFNSREVYGMGDPSPNHIALLKDHVNNHLAYINDTRTEDNVWHHVKIVVRERDVEVIIDGGRALTWTGEIDRSYGHMGFSSGILGLDNWHIVDDFKLYRNTITVTGLQPGWIAELYSEGGLVGRGVAAPGGTEAIIDVSGVGMPMKGYFEIYSQKPYGEPKVLLHRSQVFDTLGGGDVWSLRSKEPATATTTLPPTAPDNWLIYAAVVSVAVVVVAAAIVLRVRGRFRGTL